MSNLNNDLKHQILTNKKLENIKAIATSTIIKTTNTVIFSGFILDIDDDKPIVGAKLIFETNNKQLPSIEKTSDNSGYFLFEISANDLDYDHTLKVEKEHYNSYEFTLNRNDLHPSNRAQKFYLSKYVYFSKFMDSKP